MKGEGNSSVTLNLVIFVLLRLRFSLCRDKVIAIDLVNGDGLCCGDGSPLDRVHVAHLIRIHRPRVVRTVRVVHNHLDAAKVHSRQRGKDNLVAPSSRLLDDIGVLVQCQRGCRLAPVAKRDLDRHRERLVGVCAESGGSRSAQVSH